MRRTKPPAAGVCRGAECSEDPKQAGSAGRPLRRAGLGDDGNSGVLFSSRNTQMFGGVLYTSDDDVELGEAGGDGGRAFIVSAVFFFDLVIIIYYLSRY